MDIRASSKERDMALSPKQSLSAETVPTCGSTSPSSPRGKRRMRPTQKEFSPSRINNRRQTLARMKSPNKRVSSLPPPKKRTTPSRTEYEPRREFVNVVNTSPRKSLVLPSMPLVIQAVKQLQVEQLFSDEDAPPESAVASTITKTNKEMTREDPKTTKVEGVETVSPRQTMLNRKQPVPPELRVVPPHAAQRIRPTTVIVPGFKDDEKSEDPLSIKLQTKCKKNSLFQSLGRSFGPPKPRHDPRCGLEILGRAEGESEEEFSDISESVVTTDAMRRRRAMRDLEDNSSEEEEDKEKQKNVSTKEDQKKRKDSEEEEMSIADLKLPIPSHIVVQRDPDDDDELFGHDSTAFSTAAPLLVMMTRDRLLEETTRHLHESSSTLHSRRTFAPPVSSDSFIGPAKNSASETKGLEGKGTVDVNTDGEESIDVPSRAQLEHSQGELDPPDNHRSLIDLTRQQLVLETKRQLNSSCNASFPASMTSRTNPSCLRAASPLRGRLQLPSITSPNRRSSLLDGGASMTAGTQASTPWMPPPSPQKLVTDRKSWDEASSSGGLVVQVETQPSPRLQGILPLNPRTPAIRS